jgi:hypothetical protein
MGQRQIYTELQWESQKKIGSPRWEDNINMRLREIEGGGMDWIDLVQDRD